MRNATHSVLAALVTTTIVVTAALGWAAWRLIDQERLVEEKRARDQTEARADAVAAEIRGKLAEAGDRLSTWVSDPDSTPPSIAGAVVLTVSGDRVAINPAGGLPFVPIEIPAPDVTAVFSVVERMEFAGQSDSAAALYRALTSDSNPRIEAAALLRLARVQRKRNDFSGALITYRRLTALGPVRIGELPAELAGLVGERASHLALSDTVRGDELARRIAQGIDNGRWLIQRGPAQLYRDGAAEHRPAAWNLANALSDLWRDGEPSLSPRGQRVLDAIDRTQPAVIVLWRSNGLSIAAMAASSDRFFDVGPAPRGTWQLSDPDGRVIHGVGPAPRTAVARVIGNSDFPWTLYVHPMPAGGSPNSRRPIVAMTLAMVIFVWAASYFIARAIRREAAVARLQSDFVAAVSHEFRSPLTAVKQLADMLVDDRVATNERRQRYYALLAQEANRLQRLVETLLNFGRMDAGAAQYQFVELDAGALILDVVKEIEPQARQSGKTIEAEGTPLTIQADQQALSMAVRNLLDNAIKYSPGQPTIWVRWRRQDDGAAICVVDRGVGIAASERDTIFHKFVRGQAAVNSRIHGTGVGLSMVKHIAVAHGGEVEVESEPGRGSTFTLRLPARN